MESQRKNDVLPIWLVALILVFGLSIRLATDKGETMLAIDRLHSSFADSFFFGVTQLGDALPYWVFVFVFLFVRFRYALTVGTLGLTTLVLTGTLKSLFGQPRPFTWFGDAGLLHLLTPVDQVHLYDAYNSFPSGHTLAAFTLFVFLALVAKPPWLKGLLVGIAALVGFSRMYLHLHFIEDVLFGAVCGTCLAWTGYWLQNTYLKNRWAWDDSLRRFLRLRRA